tara:strand:- start:851 stop:1798 length:948 start_codon:yes stop_codon:yes gene_type:complete
MKNKFEKSLSSIRRDIPKKFLRRTNINHLLLDAIIDNIVIFLCCLVYFHSILLVKIICIVIIISRLHSFGVIVHELTHLPMTTKGVKIRLIEILTAYPIGTTINAMRYHHIRHHKDSGMGKDPYFHHFEDYKEKNIFIRALYILIGIILVPSWIIRSFFGVFCLFSKRLRIVYARVFMEHKLDINTSDLREVHQCCKEDILQSIYFISFIVIIAVNPSYINHVIYLYLIPICIVGIISYYRLMKEHTYIVVHDRSTDSIINSTCDHNITGWTRFVLAPRNIGYHIVHHLHPQVGYRYLPDLRNYYRSMYPDQYPD